MSDWLFRLPYLPENAAAQYGENIDGLLHLITYIVTPWVVLTFGLIILFTIIYRKRKDVESRYLTAHETLFSLGNIPVPKTALIEVPTLLVLALDMWIFFASVTVWADIKQEMPVEEFDEKVKVVGKQFEWEFYYPGPDGKLDTEDDIPSELKGEVHIPAGKYVKLLLSSDDVIHSFFVPHLRFKQDAVPGRKLEGWIRAEKPTRPFLRENRILRIVGDAKSKLEEESTEHVSTYNAKVKPLKTALDVQEKIPDYGTVEQTLSGVIDWIDSLENLSAGARSNITERLQEARNVARGILEDQEEFDGFFHRDSYEVPCAELCGYGHSGMLGYIVVQPPDVYKKYMNENVRR